jgi:hypothetical protein
MSTLRLKLAAVALVSALGASAAHAQSYYPSLFGKQRAVAVKTVPSVTVEQQGRDNGAAVGQSGPRNTAGIGQQGASNNAQINQTGANNNAGVYQIGRNNDGAITQTGNGNDACLVQLGKNQSGEINQTGNGNSVGVIQTKKGVYEIPATMCEETAKKAKAVRWFLGRVY